MAKSELPSVTIEGVTPERLAALRARHVDDHTGNSSLDPKAGRISCVVCDLVAHVAALQRELEQERQRSAAIDGRRREARQLLAKACRLSRRPAAIEQLLMFMEKVGDYLNRTSDPRDILREAATEDPR